MKIRKISLLVLLLGLTTIGLTAQEKSPRQTRDGEIQTLFGNNPSHGGYGAISLGYTQIDGKDAIMAGGRIAWVIDHCFAIGFSGYGFANDVYLDDIVDGRNLSLSGGYGGLFLEPIAFPRSPVHLAFPVTIGVGGMSYITDYYWSHTDEWYPEPEDVDPFLIVEPGIELEFNVFKFLRLAVGSSVRITDNITLANTPKDVLRGYSGNLTLKIGKF